MKKMRNLLALAIIGSVLFVSCGDDTTKPVVTLRGAADTTIALNSTWIDPGATAEDDEDGVITDIQVTGTVNVNLTGTYIITYSATDAAGNTGTKSRTVRVRNTAEGWAGSYVVADIVEGELYTYSDIISYSQTENRYVWVTKFAYYTNGAVKFKFENPETIPTDITLPQQTVHCGTAPYDADRTFSGSGEATIEGSFYIDYIESTYGTSVEGTETYTKQ
ncbi:MAG TPA: DUF5011 domain-containing protein [Bacteroidales bacterium]|nr:DUF5011 domain-containing protein [Bacteroidales bacterium]